MKKKNRNIHHVTIRNLDPESEYYFRIESGNKIYSGETKSFSTTTVTEEFPEPKTIIGKVALINGNAPKDGLVFYTMEGRPDIEIKSQPLSENGSFSIDISSQLEKLNDGSFDVYVNDLFPVLNIDVQTSEGEVFLGYVVDRTDTAEFVDIGTLVLDIPENTTAKDISVSDGCIWSCNGACAGQATVDLFNSVHGGNGQCNWLYEAGCGACSSSEGSGCGS